MAEMEKKQSNTQVEQEDRKPRVHLWAQLKDDGFDVIGAGAQERTLKFRDNETGKEYEKSKDDLLAYYNLDPSEMDIQWSHPTTALPTSPLDVSDRLLLGLGNKEGNIAYLKQKYSEVAEAKNGDLLVKDGDMWHRVDGENGDQPDAWAWTREILSDVAEAAPGLIRDIGSEVIGTVSGVAATVGTAPAAGPGAVAAGIGARALVKSTLQAGLEGLRTSLGRMAGTYPEDAEQQFKDAATEFGLNFVGEVVLPGGGKLLKGLKGKIAKDRATKMVEKKFFNSAVKLSSKPEGAKGALSEGIGFLNGTGQHNTYTLLKRPKQVQKSLEGARKLAKGSATETTQDVLYKQAGDHIENIGRVAQKALTDFYEKGLDDVVKTIPPGFSIKNDDIAQLAMTDLKSMGITNIVKRNGKYTMTGFSADDLVKLQNAAGTDALVGQELPKHARRLITDAYSNLVNLANAKKTLTNKAMLGQIKTARRQLGNSIYGLKKENPALAAHLAQIQQQFDKNIVSKLNTIPSRTKAAGAIATPPVGDAFLTHLEKWSQFKELTDQLQTVTRNEQGMTFAMRMQSEGRLPAGARGTLNDILLGMEKYAPNRLKKVRLDIERANIAMSAAAYSKVFPTKSSLGTRAASTAIGVEAVSEEVSKKSLAAIVGVTSPAVFRKAVQATDKTLGVFRNMPKKSLKKMSSDMTENPNKIRAMFNPIKLEVLRELAEQEEQGF